jgi:hypothetical protein
MTYTVLRRVPRTIPEGLIVAHNHIRPAKPIGLNGFRAWLTEPSDKYERCDCGWANGLEHFRVNSGASR